MYSHMLGLLDHRAAEHAKVETFWKSLTAGYPIIHIKVKLYWTTCTIHTYIKRKQMCSFIEAHHLEAMSWIKTVIQSKTRCIERNMRRHRVPELPLYIVLQKYRQRHKKWGCPEKGFQHPLIQLKTWGACFILKFKHCSVLTQYTAEVFRHYSFWFLICLVHSLWKHLVQWCRNLQKLHTSLKLKVCGVIIYCLIYAFCISHLPKQHFTISFIWQQM